MSSTVTEIPQDIPSFNFRYVSHEQLRGITENIAAKWKKAEVKPTTIEVALQNIELTLPLHLKALYRDNGSDHTERIKDSDHNRDRANSQFFGKVTIASNEWDEAVAAAGSKLKKVISETIGSGLNGLPYAIQTSKTDDMIKILSSTENQKLLEICSLMNDFNRVVTYNDKFKMSYEYKVQDESNSEVVPPLKDLTYMLQCEVRKILEDTEYLYINNHPSVDRSLFNDIHTYVKDLVELINKTK